MTTEIALPPSILTRKQTRLYGPKPIAGRGPNRVIRATVRYDDQCGNGHNSFSITGEIYKPGGLDFDSGGCIHDEIAKAFPELAPYIKWHLCSSDGPMHYVANTVFRASDRDHWGLRKGEFRQHTSRGPNQNKGVAGVPCWELVLPERTTREVYSLEKPAPVVCEWQPNGITGEGQAREFANARSCAIWPEATDEQLSLPPEELKALLLARLPALMLEFKAAVESLGFVY